MKLRSSRPPSTLALRPSTMCSVSPSDALGISRLASGDVPLDPDAAGGVEHAPAIATIAARIPDLVRGERCTVFLDGPRRASRATHG
jgi:hypothetical protein